VRTETNTWREAAALAACLLLAGCRQESPPEIPTGRLARASGESPRTLRSLVPEECRVGEVFQKLENGEAGLLVLGTGLSRGDTVFWNGRALRTAFGHSRLVTAAVPPELLQSPGRVEVIVEDTIDPSHPKLRAEFLIRASP
jgi:hypothetical protein